MSRGETHTQTACTERAQKFAAAHYTHPRFNGYTKTEVAQGCAFALLLVEESVARLPTDGQPLAEADIGWMLDKIGINDAEGNRALGVAEIAIELLLRQ